MTRAHHAAGRLDDRGLDLTRPGSATPEEVAAFRRSYEESKGYSLPAFEFWLDVRPELVKRHRAVAVQIPSEATQGQGLPAVLAVLHYYAVTGYQDGIGYEIHLAEHLGAGSDDVWDTLAFAFIHAGPRGMRFVASGAEGWKRAVPRRERREGVFPAHWSSDAAPLRTGIDTEAALLLPGERQLVEEWYGDVMGEVPGHVRLMLDHRPHLFKAWRSRLETALSGGLPVQMVAYFLIHLNVHRGLPGGIREAVLLGRHLGMTDDEIHDAVLWCVFYGGVDAVDVAAEVLASVGVGDLPTATA